MELSDQHREYLHAHAVTDQTISEQGVHSEGDEILFPWRDDVTGEVTVQRRPWPGESGVYYWEDDKPLHFWTLRDAGPDAPILIVEGTKQSLAAASWAPDGYTLYGMPGCWGWSKVRLSRFRGRDLILCLDADAGSNLDVYDAGETFGQKVKRFGANMRYLRFPGTGSQGLDDYLSTLDAEDRTDILAYEIDNAGSKPSERRPTVRKRRMEEELPDTGGRPGVAVNLDRKTVIDKITGALKDQHDGRTLFNYGDILTRVTGHETQPLDRDRFHALLADSVACFRYSEATQNRPAIFEPTWPDGQTVGSVMSKAETFSSLRRVVRVPFLRQDGTVCYTPGYDRETATVLVTEGLDDVLVPDAPTESETRMAAKFLLDEWLGDMPFKTSADRANALALVLTPFMRGIVPLAPLCVVSGLQMGVGKNLLADCIALLATGSTADPLPWVQDDEEMRKMITSAFSSGAELFVFDEAHVIQGAQLARAVTSLTYADRILGVSRLAKYPNAVTWVSLGNQVKVNGDMARRVYFVYLHPSGRNVIDREAKCFRHPDLKAWTAENRGALVSAALTVLRGWVVAGRPGYSRGATMGSFEPWDRMLSGVLAYAGHPEFLTDMRERRSESDFVTSYWEAHVHWLHAEFGGGPFTTAQVKEAALRDPKGYEAPPKMEDASGKDFTRLLGQAYASHADRDYNGVRLVKVGIGHRSTIRWGTMADQDNTGHTSTTDGGNGGNGGAAPSLPATREPSEVVTRAHAHTYAGSEGGGLTSVPSVTSTAPDPWSDPTPVATGPVSSPAPVPAPRTESTPFTGAVVGFDLETASADELFSGNHEGPFARLVGSVFSDQSKLIDTDPGFLLSALNDAEVIHGHDALRFDLVALARHAGADYDALAQKTVDTLVLARLVDPPGAKGMKPWGEKGYYGLDQLANRLGGQGKTHDLKALALEFCPEGETDADGRKLTEKERVAIGFSRIPQDDPRYRDYLQGDLGAQDFVYRELTKNGLTDYARREMRVEWLKNRMTLNGWAIDTELLARRVAGERARIAEAKERLAEVGVPLRKPDKIKLKKKAEWPDQSYSIEQARDLMRAYPDLAVERGYATRTPGEEHKSPWATDEGRTALERAFQAAGAEFVPRTATGALALSADALGEGTWMNHEGKSKPGLLAVYGSIPAVREIAEALSLATGASSKYAEIQRFVVDGRVHPVNGQPQASGRWATTRPAKTNLGAHGEALEQRDPFIADPGHVLLTVDASQIDMRGIAGLCQDPEYMKLFAPGRDAHMDMAEVYFGERTPEARRRTKGINHKVNYGGSAQSTAEMNGIPLTVVERALAARAEAYPRLIEWTQEVRELAASGALLDNGFGRLMRPDPARAWTQGPALMGQGCARDLVCESILRLVDAHPEVTPYLRGVVHDELIVSVPEDEAEMWQGALKDAFTWEWRGVPILCSVSNPAQRWSECEH